MIKAILKSSRFELENLLFKRSVWIITAIYTLFSLVICLSEDLRHSYFSIMESVPVTLNNVALPIALVFILISALAPIFANDREQKIEQIPAACFIGSKGRSIAKIIGAVAFSVIIVLMLEIITLVMCVCFDLTDSDIFIRYVRAEIELTHVWTSWQHIGFSAATLIVGSIIFAFLVLLISCSVQSTLSAISISVIIVFIEFLINRFSFPTILQEFNIWVFFRPYYFFVMEIFNISPLINLLMLLLAFLPLCLLSVWRIIRKGI